MDELRIEKVKALIDLSKLSFARYDQRKKYHWQLSIGFWALIVGAIIYKDKFCLPEYYKNPIVLAGSALIYVLIWLWPVWCKGEREKAKGNYYQHEAKSMLSDEKYNISAFSDPKSTKWYRFFCDLGTYQHLIITVILFWFPYRANFCP